MGGLPKIEYGAFLLWILQHEEKNQMNGGFFVDGFFKEGPKTLEELQAEIASGNTQWIDRLCYYSGQAAGFPGY